MKLFVLSSLAGTGLILTAAFTPATLVEKQAEALKEAKTLKVTYTLRVNGVAGDYTLTYAKPNMLMVDGPDKLVESDGTTIWELNKKSNTFTETPSTPELLAKSALGDAVLGWASFFTDSFVKNISDVKQGSARTIKGQSATEVSFTYGSIEPKTITLYVDDKLGVARGFSFTGKSGEILALAAKVETGTDVMSTDKFAFAAPTGATKIVAPVPDPNSGFASIQPILAANCSPCHNGRGKGGFSIDSYAAVMKGARSGPVVTAGDENSRLIQLITGQAQPKMPPSGDVAAGDVDKLKAWIKAGAKE